MPALPAPANFARVDDVLWRSARPTADEFRWLAAMGCKTVINLELLHDDASVFSPDAGGFKFLRLPTWEPLAIIDRAAVDQHLYRFFMAVGEYPRPVLVHCHDGVNRTGLDVAAYRLLRLYQPIDDVIRDMLSFKGLWDAAYENYLRGLTTRRTAIGI